MSFASEAKAELCKARIHKKCCALAESYGVLLYANTFSAREIRVITASADLAQRLPRLFRRDFGLEFDRVPAENARGKAKMNSESSDGKYTELLANLRAAMKQLAARIEPKVYEYGFLKR